MNRLQCGPLGEHRVDTLARSALQTLIDLAIVFGEEFAFGREPLLYYAGWWSAQQRKFSVSRWQEGQAMIWHRAR
jgi:hypothetical protein